MTTGNNRPSAPAGRRPTDDVTVPGAPRAGQRPIDVDVDDEDDDVTMAADSDLVAQIRARALANRQDSTSDAEPAVIDPAVMDPAVIDLVDGDSVDDADPDDDVTAPASAHRRSSVARTPVIRPSPSHPTEPVDDDAAPVHRVQPIARPVAAPLVSPFADDERSLIADTAANGAAANPDRAWQPPAHFTPEAQSSAASSPIAMWKLVAILAVAIIVTAVVTALTILAVMD